MDSNRKTAIIVGVLFIIATVSSILSVVLGANIHDPDYLINFSENKTQVMIGVLLMLTAAASIAGIPIVMFPILKKHNESLALGYVGARIFEGFFFVVFAIILLSILSLSQEFVNAVDPVASYFQTSGALLLAVFDWTSILLDFPFPLGALMLNYLLYTSKLIPRWLSIWGLIGAPLMMTVGLVGMFGDTSLSESAVYLAAPIALQEMVFAGWLIVKGFNSSAITSGSANRY